MLSKDPSLLLRPRLELKFQVDELELLVISIISLQPPAAGINCLKSRLTFNTVNRSLWRSNHQIRKHFKNHHDMHGLVFYHIKKIKYIYISPKKSLFKHTRDMCSLISVW